MLEIKKAKDRFYIGQSVDDDVARITWEDKGDNVIAITHTFVSPELRGQAIAGKLLNEVVKMAREQNIKIIPVCSYAVKKMTRNDELIISKNVSEVILSNFKKIRLHYVEKETQNVMGTRLGTKTFK